MDGDLKRSSVFGQLIVKLSGGFIQFWKIVVIVMQILPDSFNRARRFFQYLNLLTVGEWIGVRIGAERQIAIPFVEP